MLDLISNFIGSSLTPVILLITALILIPYVKTRQILRPKAFVSSVLGSENRSSAWRSLSLALAGTLGVGNITGVTSAIVSGGPGSIFWMWAGSIVVISVKYAEVYLAMIYRQSDKNGKYGGAMYYIRDGIGKIIGENRSRILGGIFAILCIANSLITGNIVQANAASCVFPEEKRFLSGIVLAVLVLFSITYGTRKIEKITSHLIPPLAGFYMVVCLYVIISNITLIPKIFADIISSALSSRAIFGGAVGFGVREALRFGIMRGIFSNEAGCGTSPTAHASSSTENPHSQACCGIIEVIFDTIVLCTMTAFVLLIADSKASIIPWHSLRDVSAVTLDAFTLMTNNFIHSILLVSIVLFAYATIIAQFYYGMAGINYLTNKKWLRIVYSALSVICAVAGSVISAEAMWLSADIIIGIMTSANCIFIIILRKDLRLSHNQRGLPH
ncbi:MAG: sodium:alanine symporter family protein [Ruminococcaceae bacterium]|nr:sodium:alanine symporter family protein [Oscillospiraceae bacterium]